MCLWERVTAQEEESASQRKEKTSQAQLQGFTLGDGKEGGRRKRQPRSKAGLRKAGLF